MKVYDFDGTIYDGDSSKDFIMFVYRRHPSIMFTNIPRQIFSGIRYLFGKCSKEMLKEDIFSFISKLKNIDIEVQFFWDKHQKKIMEWYRARKETTDVIISASPCFLLENICEREGIRYLIATQMDKTSGKINGKNCKGREKVKRFCKLFPDAEIEEFYSDHMSDRYMAALAQKSYFIKRKRLVEWKI